jgi:hypothetical protein
VNVYVHADKKILCFSQATEPSQDPSMHFLKNSSKDGTQRIQLSQFSKNPPQHTYTHTHNTRFISDHPWYLIRFLISHHPQVISDHPAKMLLGEYNKTHLLLIFPLSNFYPFTSTMFLVYKFPFPHTLYTWAQFLFTSITISHGHCSTLIGWSWIVSALLYLNKYNWMILSLTVCMWGEELEMFQCMTYL